MKQDFSQFKAPAETLPPGERVIWQGKPSVRGLALRAFHIREVAIYFALVLAWRLWSAASAGLSVGDAIVSATWILVPAVVAIAVLSGLAWAFARASLYTITSKRVMFQFGVALPMTLNIPLSKIANAALKTYRDGSGDIPLTLSENKGSFLLLWPHVRPWQLRVVQPMFRSIPDVANVAAKLAEALANQPGPVANAVHQLGVSDPFVLSTAAAAA